MSDSPDLSKRRTRVKAAPDEGRDPIDRAMESKAATAEGSYEPRVRKLDRINIETTPEVSDTLEFAKYKTGKTKRALVEEAVLSYWNQYRGK